VEGVKDVDVTTRDAGNVSRDQDEAVNPHGCGERRSRWFLFLVSVRKVRESFESIRGQARGSLAPYLDFYNRKRPHSSLAARTSDRAYCDHPPLLAAA
jgi:hypothetical protein